MSHITPIDYETASEAVRAEHDREMQLRGRMTNMKRTLLHSPVAHRIYAEWFPLREELRPALDDRAVWLLCHAIALECRSIIPVGFFRRLVALPCHRSGMPLDHSRRLLPARADQCRPDAGNDRTE